MGQYLSIGICTNFSISKSEMKSAKTSIEEIEDALQNEGYYLPIFERQESENAWKWSLKESIFTMEMAQFVEKQLDIFGETDDDVEQLLADLKNCKSKNDFWGLAEQGNYECFQWDRYGESDYISMSFGKHLRINYDCIMLFSAGKISMESDGGLFQYFVRNIVIANPEFEIAKALKVYITG